MNYRNHALAILAVAVIAGRAMPQEVPGAGQMPAIKTTVDEVLLDMVVRDKKGKPITDLKAEDVTVFDNNVKQDLTSFRLVRGTEAISQSGAKTTLDPLRQVRLVTLAFDSLAEADQRKTARIAASDLIKGGQGANVFYSVVVINQQLLVLQPFTTDRPSLVKAIENATAGLAANRLASESEALKGELKRRLNGQTVNGADQDVNLLAAATATAGQPVANGSQALQAKLASVLLDMLHMDAAIGANDTRLSISALQSLVRGLQAMPGRKSVLYFTAGMTRAPELDEPFRNLMGMANRSNVTFYSLDTRGVMTSAQNLQATAQLQGAAAASRTTINRTEGAVTKEEIRSSDNAENSIRANPQLAIRDLAESTGGFLIGNSNDLRTPLRQVNEEIASYYEVSYRPAIQAYDGSFRKVKVESNRKDLVIHARNGYFAMPPEVRSSGLEAFELPLLTALSRSTLPDEISYRAGAIRLRPRNEGTDLSLLVEVPLRGLQPRSDETKRTLNVHFSVAALVKDVSGAVVQKLSHDRGFQVTADQLKMGNFLEKMAVTVGPGKYTLESAVMDRESGKIGAQRSEFDVAPKAGGVGISSLVAVRSYTPNVRGIDPDEPFQFQGGSITPTLNDSVTRGPDSVLRLFVVVYKDLSKSEQPTMEIEFLQNGASLTKASMALPAADAQGRIPYVMTIPTAGIPAGAYEVHATARQGASTAKTKALVKIEGR